MTGASCYTKGLIDILQKYEDDKDAAERIH